MTLTLEQELLLLRQDARIILENQAALCDQQRTMGGLIDLLLETDDEQIKQIRRLESEKAALLAANQELQMALQRIVKEYAR